MIIDHLDKAPIYHNLGPRLATALAYLPRCDFNSMEDGRYDIDGDNIFALVQRYETRNQTAESRWEVHRRYIDVQYVVAGAEKMGYAHAASLIPATSYDSARDIQFLHGTGDFYSLSKGFFTIFFPADAHLPGLSNGEPENVIKVVVKVGV